ncbi:MAG: DUF2155 domain-containing protein [Rhodobacteraceae bacterium]|nr:DUF2155 domain-containing protein [Paracoccaceae bacterium]
MRRFFPCLFVLLLAGFPVLAQSNVETKNGVSAQIRALDTITGEVRDLDLQVGETVAYERLTITLQECRYPANNPAADAFALLVVKDVREDTARFSGWMIASSPALSALEHPRYDVWLLSCNTSDE